MSPNALGGTRAAAFELHPTQRGCQTKSVGMVPGSACPKMKLRIMLSVWVSERNFVPTPVTGVYWYELDPGVMFIASSVRPLVKGVSDELAVLSANVVAVSRSIPS